MTAVRSYHINSSTGEPHRCKTVDGNCEAGYSKHYPTYEAAKAAVSWVFKVKPPRRAAAKISLGDIRNDWRRAAVDSLFESEHSLREAWRVALKHFDGLCYLCGKSIYDRRTGQELGDGDMKATADHIIPAAQGGITAAGNLAPSHLKCNNARGSEPLELYLAGNQEMLNRVRNFQKKYKYTPLSESQLKQINDSLEMLWEGMKAQIEVLRRLV